MLTGDELIKIELGIETMATQLHEMGNNLIELKEKLDKEWMDTEKT